MVTGKFRINPTMSLSYINLVFHLSFFFQTPVLQRALKPCHLLPPVWWYPGFPLSSPMVSSENTQFTVPALDQANRWGKKGKLVFKIDLVVDVPWFSTFVKKWRHACVCVFVEADESEYFVYFLHLCALFYMGVGTVRVDFRLYQFYFDSK